MDYTVDDIDIFIAELEHQIERLKEKKMEVCAHKDIHHIGGEYVHAWGCCKPAFTICNICDKTIKGHWTPEGFKEQCKKEKNNVR